MGVKSKVSILLHSRIVMKLFVSLLACLIWLPGLPQQLFEKMNLDPITSNVNATPSAAWEDYDNDGDLDVFVCLGESDGFSSNSFYVNNGNGTFTAVSGSNILTPGQHTLGASWGDFNNDGYPDLFVSHGNIANYQNNNLFKNNKDGTFTPVVEGHIVNNPGWSVGASWADFNKDGFLDLLVSNNENFNGTNDKNYLYINNQNETFTWRTDAAFGNLIGRWMANLVADYDNDGWPDVVLINRDGRSLLFKNNQNGNFVDVTTTAGFAEDFNSRGGCWGDYNNDGFMDLFVAKNGNKSLYKNNGDGTFTKIGVGELVFESYKSNGSSWGDLDNDGDLDLVISNEDPSIPNSIYYNDGNGNFVRHYTSVASLAGFSYANNLIDYDNDGDLDIFVLNRDQENYLFRNVGNCNNWLKVKLDSGLKNRLGVGAKVKIKTSNGDTGWQTREINTQSGGGYSAQNGTLAHFGTGAAQVIDSLLVLWPEGDTTILSALAANQFVIISRDKPPVIVHRSPASPLSIVSNDSTCAGTTTLQAIGGRNGYRWSLKEDEATVIGTGAELQWPVAINTTFVLQDGCGDKTEKEIKVLDECHGSCVLEPLTILPTHQFEVCEGTYITLIGQGGRGSYKWYSTQHPNDILQVGNSYSWSVEISDTIKVMDKCLLEDAALIFMKDECDTYCTVITGDLSIQKNKTVVMPGESVDLQVVNENGIVTWYLLPVQQPFATGNQLSLILTDSADVVAIDHCGRADTIHLETLFIPNVITPNNDNLNEVFEIKGVDEPLQLTIVNRWGENVYERAEYNNSWDGDNLPEGIYYYKVSIGNPKRLIYRGSVSILR